MESVLKIDKLKYKDVLKEVTFSLEDKSFNILVGSNGSGKTTIINAIRGLIKYEGNITLFDNDIKNKDSNSEVGFFLNDNIKLEDTLFNELLNMLKNLDYEEDKAKKRIFSVAKKFDATYLLYKKLEDLLEYEKIVISFIFSIIHEPRLLIIDNDLEKLDSKHKNKILDHIRSQKKLTTLFITNNSEYFYDTDKVLLLSDGKIIELNSFEEILKNEKKLIKCGSSLPFYADLSNKLMSYELFSSNILDAEEMVNEIWK